MLGDRHAQTISTIDALGAVLYMEADLAGAEVLLLEALQLRRETLGDKHPDTIHSISNTGMLLKDKRDFVGAEELLSEAVTAMRESTDEAASSAQGQGSSSSSSSSLLICQSNLGTLYKDKGDLVKAEKNKNKAAVAPSAASTWLAGVVEKTHLWTQGVSDFFKEDEDAKVKALTANVDIDKLVVAFRKFAGFNDELTREEYKLFAQDVELPSKMAESLVVLPSPSWPSSL